MASVWYSAYICVFIEIFYCKGEVREGQKQKEWKEQEEKECNKLYYNNIVILVLPTSQGTCQRNADG